MLNSVEGLMRTEPPGTAAEQPTLVPAPRERAEQLHLRLLAVDALFAWVPSFVASRARTLALRAAGIKIGRVTMFFGHPRFAGSGDIQKRLQIGEYCGFNKGTFFDLEDDITIHDHVAVGHDVMLLTRSYATGTAVQRAGAPLCAPIVIGPGAWLGARCMVLPGVTIGAGSVIGAGVIVSQDVPENTLLTGTQRVSIARWR
jgi:maltose O-acetyltransferase